MLRPSGVLFLPARRHRAEALLECGGAALHKGQLVGIFPEGMDNFLRETPPRSVGAFHSAFARLLWKERAVPLVPVAIVGSLDERRLGLPGSLFSRLDPCNPQFPEHRVWGVLYRTATIRFGPPLTLPNAPTEEAFVAEVTERTRQAVLALMREGS
ncbi:MAG TPA: 1-acyl-sn-glycerol-3-phosphate acyltransferase, partial [Stenomitos sp.]